MVKPKFCVRADEPSRHPSENDASQKVGLTPTSVIKPRGGLISRPFGRILSIISSCKIRVKEFQKMFATFFYIGDIPVAPGSAASGAALLLAVGLMDNIPLYIVVTILVTIVGFLVSGRVEANLKQKDPSCIVIDEVAGGLIAFFLLPMNWPVLITAYFLFRAFDMFKIYPVDKFESLPGSTGIMMDDLFAGLYTNIAMHLALRLSGS